jgi:hypothetical protein
MVGDLYGQSATIIFAEAGANGEGAVLLALWFFVGGLLCWTLLGGVALRMACSASYLITGDIGPAGFVPRLALGRAIGITWLSLLAGGGCFLGPGWLLKPQGQPEIITPIVIVSVCAAVLVMGLLLKSWLPTSFKRAVLIAAAYWLTIPLLIGALLWLGLMAASRLL